MSLPLTQSFQFSQPRTGPTGNSRKRRIAQGIKKSKRAKMVAVPRPRFASRSIAQAFPTKKRVTLSYVEYFSQTPNPAGGATGVTFRLNCPYDPNQSGLGHQAMGWDQWSQFYNRYTVISAKIVYQAASIDTANKANLHGIVIHNPVTGLPSTTDIIALSEDDDGVHGYVPADGTSSVLSRSVDIAKYFAITNPTEDDTLQAVMTAVPARELRAYCWLAAAPGTVVAGGLTTYMIRITYDVQLSEPKDLPIS